MRYEYRTLSLHSLTAFRLSANISVHICNVATVLILIVFLICSAHSATAQSKEIPTDTISVKVYFRQGYSILQPSFRQNGVRLGEFVERLSELHGDSTVRLSSIDIVAYASPEGSYTLNKRLARKRADNIASYLKDNLPFLPASLYNVQPKGINWEGLTDMVEASDMKYRSEVLNILRNTPENTYRNGKLVDSRLKRLMDLRGGRPYRVMYEYFFPTLRAAGAYVICDFERIEPVEKPDTVPSVTVGDNEVVEVVEPVYIEDPDSVTAASVDTLTTLDPPLATFRDNDRWAIKSNALYLAAGVSNLGTEYAFHPHWSVDFPLVYSPYTIARTYRMRFLYIQPEARYWLDSPMKGHFFGVHLHAGVFNVSLDKNNRYQSEKGFHGGGISYGYSLPFAKRWSVEFTIGVGYAFTKYCTYYNVPNGIRYEKDIPYNYWGITKLGVNIVYRFGDKSGKRKEVKP